MTELNNERQQQKVSHKDLSQSLRAVDSDTTASEAHGVISGVLCVSSDDQSSSKWVPLLLSDAAQMEAEAVKKLSLLLLYLHQNTRTDLKANDFKFDLVMPDDNFPVATRIEALADWCRGFLLGLSVHGIDNQAGNSSLAEQQKEFIEDLIEISNVQTGQESENTADGYLLELHEFVRVGVQAVFDENQLNSRPAPAGKKH